LGLRVKIYEPRDLCWLDMPIPATELAVHILSKVPREKAFRFYTGIASPTQSSADDLESFLNSVKTVEPRSIEFHMGREDFENWIQMLGDEMLTRQIRNLKEKKLTGEVLRKRLVQILQLRYGRLRKTASLQTREKVPS